MILHTYGYQKVAKEGGTHITINNGGGSNSGGNESKKDKDETPKGENVVTKGLRAGAAAAGAATLARGAISDSHGDSVLGHAKKLRENKGKAKKHAKDASKAKGEAEALRGKWFKWGEKKRAQGALKFSSSRAKHYAREGANAAKKLSASARGKLAGPASLAAGMTAAAHFTSNKDERDEAKREKANNTKSVKKDK